MKTNSKNTSVSSILTSNASGVGKTDSLPELYSFDGQSFKAVGYESVTLSDNVIKALFINNLHREFKNHKNLQSVIDAYSADYLGTFHASADSDNKKTSQPMARYGKVESAIVYRQNCIKENIRNLDAVLIEDLLDRVLDINSKTGKEAILSIVSSFASFLETSENKRNYKRILDNEVKDAGTFAVLTNAGFTNIVRLVSNDVNVVDKFSSSIPAAKVDGMQAALDSNAYELLSSDFNASTVAIDITFQSIAD